MINKFKGGEVTNRFFKISIASVFIFILLVPQSIFAANENLDLLRRFDQKLNNGQSGTVYSEGENLAYTKGYQLNNYLLAYNKSGDTYWLDKFTSHLDAVQGKAQNLDGDGKLGWYSSLEIFGGNFQTILDRCLIR